MPRYFRDTERYKLMVEDMETNAIDENDIDTAMEQFQDAMDAKAEMAHEEMMLGED